MCIGDKLKKILYINKLKQRNIRQKCIKRHYNTLFIDKMSFLLKKVSSITVKQEKNSSLCLNWMDAP